MREAGGQLELLDGAHRVAAADHDGHAGIGPLGQETRHGAGPVTEGGHLEDAHGTVPEDRPGLHECGLESCPGIGADVYGRPGVGDPLDGHDLVLRAARHLLGHHHVRGQEELDTLLLGRGHDGLGVLHPLALEQALAHAEALGREERVGHAAADDEAVDPLQERLQDLDLVGDLGAADDRGEGPRRILHEAREIADLALHEKPGVGRQELRHADRGGVRAVRRAESVVHVDVAIRRQRLGELRVVGLLLGMEAQVLQEEDLAGLQATDGVLGADPDGVAGGRDRLTQQGREVLGHRSQPERVADLALGPTEVAHEHDRGAPLEEVGDGRDGRPDPGVVLDLAVLDGDVEVDPHEDPLARGVHVADGELVHGGPCALPPLRQSSRSAMYLTRSATRQL